MESLVLAVCEWHAGPLFKKRMDQSYDYNLIVLSARGFA